MTRPGLRLLAITVLALAIGFFAGLRAAASMAPSHHRWMAPPLPVNLALYEPPTTSSGASTPVAAPASPVGVVTTAQAGGAQGRQPLTGVATWYSTGPGCLCAAAGPALRRAIGTDWRGTMVEVRVPMANGWLIEVKLTDACWCVDRRGLPTLVDLSDEAFAQLAPLSRGVIKVEVGGF